MNFLELFILNYYIIMSWFHPLIYLNMWVLCRDSAQHENNDIERREHIEFDSAKLLQKQMRDTDYYLMLTL